ncbi:MAG: carbohydrate binding domain-containing protein [Thermofilaceae archaeon]
MRSKRRLRLTLLILAVLVCLSALGWNVMKTYQKREAGNVFSFYLPWDDSSETATSFSRYLHKPAGKYGYVYIGSDGHLYVSDQRIKFLGVNICGSAAFPTRPEAEGIAARLAKFGVNIVRFHHMDASWESFNIFEKPGTRRLNPAALERLDYFIAKLKENGVYVNLNLLVSRRLSAADGLPSEIEQVDWKDQQVLGFFVEEVRELQKEYAHQLLLHRNPFTNLTYAEDPAVAFVEIVNEQGLIHSWLDGAIDRLPEVFKIKLKERWNEWLKAKYGTTVELVEAWGGETRLGSEVLANPRFERDLTGWVVERHDVAQATYGLVEDQGLRVLRIQVVRKGRAGWHVQLNYPRIQVHEGEVYLVTFKARAEENTRVTVCLLQAHEPWQALSQVVSVELTPEWRTYEVVLGVSKSDDNARLDISNLGLLETTYYFSDFSMKLYSGAGLKDGENIEAGTVEAFTPGDFFGRSPQAKRDWAEFLWELERSYFLNMYRYLKDELKVRALIIGTIAGCSTPVILSELDVVDTHAYWQHPAFPGTPWDPNNWYVVNEPMVNHPLDGTVTWLASRRVLGKPFTVTEYNHPAPNMYDAEAYVILATYAALQDWDGIFAFDYGSSPRDARRIRSYFDVDQHPAKMASLLLAHAIFVRSDVYPAEELVTIPIDREVELDLLIRGKLSAWNMPGAHHLNWNPDTPLIHRFALQVGKEAPAEAAVAMSEPAYKSDNNMVTWDCGEKSRCVMIVDSPKTIAIVGYGANKTFNFRNITVEPGYTLLEGFSVIGLVSLDEKPLSESGRMLLIATGYVGNAGMEVREYGANRVVVRIIKSPSGYRVDVTPFNGMITCSNTWGSAPTVVEGIHSKIHVKASSSIEVWALDETGNRKTKVPVKVEGDQAFFEIGPEYGTIWYEISRE